MSYSLERHQKRQNFTFIDKMSEMREGKMQDFPGVHIQGSITAWGCLSDWGFGCLELFEGNMDSSHHVEKTMPNFLIPSIEKYPFGERFVFPHNNAPPHTNQISKIWLQQKNIQTIDWPPYSPDLNPIENV